MSSCILFMVIIAGAFVSTTATNYCNIKTCSPGTVHTMCKYTSSKPAPACSKWRNMGLSAAEKQTIVNVHNKLRRQVASGDELRGNPGPQPAAASMPDLVWDNELEAIAQRWVNQCIDSHDDCNDVERFMTGQNIAALGSTDENRSTVDKLITDQWYNNEVVLFDKNWVSSLPDDNNLKIFHYAQVVNGATTKIGCGRLFYTPLSGRFKGYKLHRMICNYGPSMFAGQPLYQTNT